LDSCRNSTGIIVYIPFGIDTTLSVSEIFAAAVAAKNAIEFILAVFVSFSDLTAP